VSAGNLESPQGGSHQEGEKLYFDSMKHVTTLNTGSILILVTMLEKLFPNPRWWALIAFSLTSFGFSILCSVSSMLQSAHYVKWYGNIPKAEATIKDLVYYLALISFLFGIISLVVFAMKNLFH
jgi:hypothetical protein